MAQRRTGSEHIRKIEFVFYNERAIREAVAEARAGGCAPKGRNGSGVSDPTASAAIRNVTPLKSVKVRGEQLEQPEAWLRVVDAVYAWCDQDRLAVAKDRYSGIDYRETCANLSISDTTRRAMLQDVRHFASLCAVQMGLIKFF